MNDFDVFLSYHWRDHAAVEALARRLLDAGLKVFLDRWYLTPGTNWLRELESKLARCRAVAVCTGAEMGPWQQREAHAALDRQAAAERAHAPPFPVIPVLLPGPRRRSASWARTPGSTCARARTTRCASNRSAVST